MPEVKIPSYERECIITWTMDSKTARVTTSNPVMIRKLDKLSEEFPNEYRKTRELTAEHDAVYEMPVKLLSFRKPASEARKESGRKLAQSALKSCRTDGVSET